jgi:hypothetical protein
MLDVLEIGQKRPRSFVSDQVGYYMSRFATIVRAKIRECENKL